MSEQRRTKSENRLPRNQPPGTTISDQAIEIIWAVVEDPKTGPELKRSLLEKLAQHPRDPARALLEHLTQVRYQAHQESLLDEETAS